MTKSFKLRAYERGKQVACGCEQHLNSHVHTFFSVQDGISSPEDMVDETAAKGYGGVGISDHGTMGGVLRAGRAAKEWKTGRLSDGTLINYRKVDLKKYSKKYTHCDKAWNEAKCGDGEALIVHNTQDSSKFRVLEEGEFKHVGDFKAISGCELYVSWEKHKDRKYHHITVYATGMTGHRALVLLTSLGATPSRRYTGGRGFFRPRVFMEDIELAIKEGGGEIIVTTGCPISITSTALREGNEAEAREFFDWGKRVLEDGKFFAELHICDVSLDFNRFYKDAEDKFWSTVSGVPISRFRFGSESDALSHAVRVSSVLRSVFCRSQSPLSVVNKSEIMTEDEIARSLKIYRDECERTLVAANSYADSSDEARAALEAKKAELIKEAQELGIEEKRYLKKKAKDLKKIEKKIQRPSALPDEDSIALIAYAIRVIEEKEGSVLSGEAPGVRLAKLITIIAGEILKNKEDLEVVSILQVVQSMLSVPSTFSDSEEALALLQISKNESLCLDKVLDNDRDAIETVALAESWLHEIFGVKSGDESWLNPTAGAEDELEKEWVEHSEGNWMVRVNKGLVALAKEYDVPLLIATDAHMTTPELKVTQDAIIKRGKRRNWNMSRPYAIPRADTKGFIKDAGHYHRHAGMEVKENCGEVMLREAFTMDDLIESFGSGSLILDNANCASNFKWAPTVPKIRYRDHKFYERSLEFLESGELRSFLPTEGSYVFTNKSINLPTAIMCSHYFDFIERKVIKDDEVYLDRFFRELHMSQEVGDLQLADYFIVLGHAIHLFRKCGVSVGPGRGSAAGMLLAYITEVTRVDPVAAGLSDARWMTAGRKLGGSLPDIDVDVSDREICGRVLAQIAHDAMIDELNERPLTPLEEILHNEVFFSPENVSHEELGGIVYERKRTKRDLKSIFEKNLKGEKSEDKDDDGGDEDHDTIFEDDDGEVCWGAPIFRVGTYQSLKAKAAVKEAVRIADTTPFENLPSFADPPVQWRLENQGRLKGLSDEQVNRLYESEHFTRLSSIEKTARRRVKLGDHLTKAMAAGAGMARLYRSELDYFYGSVYGEVPAYWEQDKKKPSGSADAQAYFERNGAVKDLVLSMLNIYKAPGVHAGGLCFGRDALERIPLRCDGKGYVAQYEMADIENCGVLKFDILGLLTLEQISETLKMMVSELSPQQLDWLPSEVYNRVKEGGSTDEIWDYIDLSTPEAAEALIKNRAMTFQVDTGNIGKDLDTIEPKMLMDLAASSKNRHACSNLVKMIDAVLALWRPGPMGVSAHLDYLKRLSGEPFSVIHPWLEPFVKDTFGVIAYQEQVMAIYKAATGASEDEVDDVRRAMGKKKLSVLEKMGAEKKFVSGCMNQGVPEEIAKSIWSSLLYFAEYGFNQAHSRAYAVVTAVTLFLKARYKEFFFRSIMGLAKSEEAGRFLAEIRDQTKPPCALVSDDVFWRVVDGFFYPGLNTVDGLKTKDRERLLAVRDGLARDEVIAMSPVEFFRRLMKTGNVTANFVASLSSSGLLRRLGRLGDQKTVANAYAEAVLSFKRKGPNRDSDASESSFGNELSPKKKKAPEVKFDDDEQFLINHLAERQFLKNLKGGEVADWSHGLTDEQLSELQRNGVQPLYILEARSVKELDGALAEAKEMYDALVLARGKKAVDSAIKASKAFLSKDEKEVFLSLLNSEITTEAKNLTVAAAENLCRRTKIKGLGVKSLVSALYKERGGDWMTLNDLKRLKVGEQEVDASDGITVKTAAFMNSFNWVDGKDGAEPRLTLLADGERLNAKFSMLSFGSVQIDEAIASIKAGKPNSLGTRLIELSDGGLSRSEAIKEARSELIVKAFDLVKDEKLTKPFEFTIFASKFRTKEGTQIAYYKIEDIRSIA